MNHTVVLCFHSLKYDDNNCAQKSQDYRFQKKERSPDPDSTQRRLSCGLRLACSGVPVKVWLMVETVQPTWAAVPPPGCTQGEEIVLCVVQLALLSLVFPPRNAAAWLHLLRPFLPVSGMGIPEVVPSPSQSSPGATDSPCRIRTPVVPPWWHPLTSNQLYLHSERNMAAVMKWVGG